VPDFAAFIRKTYLGAEAAEEGEPEMAQGKCEVLVEEVAEELAHPVREEKKISSRFAHRFAGRPAFVLMGLYIGLRLSDA
jgi:hypothetical protein